MNCYQGEALGSSDFIYSLIMATYGRKEEVERFIQSLLKQTFDIKKVELIVVDQNKEDFLNEYVEKYKKYIDIVHVRSEVVGSSVSRNIGISLARGRVLAFPDDDCEYYSDTLERVYKAFSKNKNINTILGQVFDRENSCKVIRDWPDQVKGVRENNFFYLYTCISVFTRNKNAFFDDRLGPNTSFGAYEDADYVLSLIKYNNGVLYKPCVQVYHPELNIDTMDLRKIKSYGMGFGGFCRKNISLYIAFIFFMSLNYHFFWLIMAFLRIDEELINKRYCSISSRIQGFCRFN